MREDGRVRVTMLLADHAVVADGKLYVNGGGWTLTSPTTPPSSIALKFDVPWDQANLPIELLLELTDADGHPVSQLTPAGPAPVQVHARLEVGRPAGMPLGAPINAIVALGIPPLVLDPGQRYTWRLHLDGQTRADWELTFTTRPE